MKYVCDAPSGRTWFRIETEEEAGDESALMLHTMVKHFRTEMAKARQSFQPPSTVFFEQEIGLKAHLQREMSMFLTLRDDSGLPLVTAMLPSAQKIDARPIKAIILGRNNAEPYMKYASDIFALGKHFGLTLDRTRCYPYPPGRH